VIKSSGDRVQQQVLIIKLNLQGAIRVMARVAIRTSNGNYVTAVNGGGMGEAANALPLHTDAVKIGPWEQFKIKFFPDGSCTIQTQTGHYLTAVNGGGIGNPANTDPLHTDQTLIGPWEKFTLEELSPGIYVFKTAKGTYLTAVGGGGKGEAANKLPLHTDAKKVGGWEKFELVPYHADRKPAPRKRPPAPPRNVRVG
jgi:hypothetical protein